MSITCHGADGAADAKRFEPGRARSDPKCSITAEIRPPEQALEPSIEIPFIGGTPEKHGPPGMQGIYRTDLFWKKSGQLLRRTENRWRKRLVVAQIDFSCGSHVNHELHISLKPSQTKKAKK